ncbi:putative nuclease associated modular domain 3 [Lupinus albus]|uniref:Putative nuclease associated modular domain 3 n=1 Tax=Lupinus albus TaxID=3870 RepID=A0A6A4P849_LUPAL|nr:putative nuclease associated modular domain 3 [Lupinus albus]
MPFFEIRNTQLLRFPMLYHGKGSSVSFAFGNEQCIHCPWKSLDKLKRENFNVRRVDFQRGSSRFLIKAVATFEPKSSTSAKENSFMVSKDLESARNSDLPGVMLEFSDDESEKVDEREKLRRMRISKANKGNTPWNKGRKHSPETLQKIKERTRIAMQNPKVKMKLVSLGHAQTTETRQKISVGVKMRWQRKRGKKLVQEICCFEWQNLIAEASRQGYIGQEELQWNSYKTLNEQLKQEWLVSVEQRKQMVRAPGSKRAPKSPEQRRKIAAAISAKWADPEYRGRVVSALAKYHGSEAGAERKPRRRPSVRTQPIRKNPIVKKDTKTSTNNVKNIPKVVYPIQLKKSKSPAYKDPLVNSKLQMIKNIRAQRAAAETEHAQAVAQARLLIAEAEKAAKALEVAALKSPIAQASLTETRKLIAEAIQSLDSIDTQEITDKSVPSVAFNEINSENGSAPEVPNQSHMPQVNGHKTLSSSDNNFPEDFSKFSSEKLLNGGDQELYITSTNGHFSFPFSLNNSITELSPSNQQRETETETEEDLSSEYGTNISSTVVAIRSIKDEETVSRSSPVIARKWICGRLVEVVEGKQEKDG